MSSMFRDIGQVEISSRYFGAGSFLIENKKHYLVVASNEKLVHLLDLTTFKTLGAANVQDSNFLSEPEARVLVSSALTCAFSDCRFDSKGLKDAYK